MNKEMIKVNLVTENEKELLIFNFEEKISLDLTNDDAEQLRNFFQSLLKHIEDKNIELQFEETDRNDLFYDVAKKYVEHLKIEISSIITQKLNMISLED